MVKHDFVVHTSWRGGREIGKVNGDVISEQISIPSSLGGNGTGTNPDEMLVAAASSCYIISLAATLERAKFTNIHLEIKSIGSAVFENGKFKMEKSLIIQQYLLQKKKKRILINDFLNY